METAAARLLYLTCYASEVEFVGYSRFSWTDTWHTTWHGLINFITAHDAFVIRNYGDIWLLLALAFYSNMAQILCLSCQSVIFLIPKTPLFVLLIVFQLLTHPWVCYRRQMYTVRYDKKFEQLQLFVESLRKGKPSSVDIWFLLSGWKTKFFQISKTKNFSRGRKTFVLHYGSDFL